MSHSERVCDGLLAWRCAKSQLAAAVFFGVGRECKRRLWAFWKLWLNFDHWQCSGLSHTVGRSSAIGWQAMKECPARRFRMKGFAAWKYLRIAPDGGWWREDQAIIFDKADNLTNHLFLIFIWRLLLYWSNSVRRGVDVDALEWTDSCAGLCKRTTMSGNNHPCPSTVDHLPCHNPGCGMGCREAIPTHYCLPRCFAIEPVSN